MEITQKLKIMNRLGLHLRAAAELVKTSCKFKCRVLIKSDKGHLNGKSLMNLLTLAAGYGSRLTLVFPKGKTPRTPRGRPYKCCFSISFGKKINRFSKKRGLCRKKAR